LTLTSIVKVKNKIELFKLLIDNNIDVSGKDNNGRDVWSYIQYDCWAKDKPEMEQIMLTKRASISFLLKQIVTRKKLKWRKWPMIKKVALTQLRYVTFLVMIMARASVAYIPPNT